VSLARIQNDDEVYPPEFLEEWEPSDTTYEPTGNAGVNAERTYDAVTVVIIWTTSVDWMVRLGGNASKLAEHIAVATKNALESGVPTDVEAAVRQAQAFLSNPKFPASMMDQRPGGHTWHRHGLVEHSATALIRSMLSAVIQLDRQELVVLFATRTLPHLAMLSAEYLGRLGALMCKFWGPELQSALTEQVAPAGMLQQSVSMANTAIQLLRLAQTSAFEDLQQCAWGAVEKWVTNLSLPAVATNRSAYTTFPVAGLLAGFSELPALRCARLTTSLVAWLRQQVDAQSPGFSVRTVIDAKLQDAITTTSWRPMLLCLSDTLKWLRRTTVRCQVVDWLVRLAGDPSCTIEATRQDQQAVLRTLLTQDNSAVAAADGSARSPDSLIALDMWPVFSKLSPDDCLKFTRDAVAAAIRDSTPAKWVDSLKKVDFKLLLRSTSWSAMQDCICSAIKCCAQRGHIAVACNLLQSLADELPPLQSNAEVTTAAHQIICGMAALIAKTAAATKPSTAGSIQECVILFRLTDRFGGNFESWVQLVSARGALSHGLIVLKELASAPVTAVNDRGIVALWSLLENCRTTFSSLTRATKAPDANWIIPVSGPAPYSLFSVVMFLKSPTQTIIELPLAHAKYKTVTHWLPSKYVTCTQTRPVANGRYHIRVLK